MTRARRSPHAASTHSSCVSRSGWWLCRRTCAITGAHLPPLSEEHSGGSGRLLEALFYAPPHCAGSGCGCGVYMPPSAVLWRAQRVTGRESAPKLLECVSACGATLESLPSAACGKAAPLTALARRTRVQLARTAVTSACHRPHPRAMHTAPRRHSRANAVRPLRAAWSGYGAAVTPPAGSVSSQRPRCQHMQSLTVAPAGDGKMQMAGTVWRTRRGSGVWW